MACGCGKSSNTGNNSTSIVGKSSAPYGFDGKQYQEVWCFGLEETNDRYCHEHVQVAFQAMTEYNNSNVNRPPYALRREFIEVIPTEDVLVANEVPTINQMKAEDALVA